MAAAVSSVPRLTFLDNTGKPLNGGNVFTYTAGTLVAKTFYSDEAKMVPVSNPIVLNAAGRPQASAIDTTEVNLYYTGSAKFVVKDANGATLYTADNVEEVAAVAGGASLAFPVTVTGGVSGGIPGFTSTTVMASSVLLPSGYTLIGGGAGATPTAVATGAPVVVALTDGATPALDASLGTKFTLTTTTNPTIAVPTNPTNGQAIVLIVTASGGARTLSLNTGAGGFRFGSDIVALTQIASGKTDYIGAIYKASVTFWDVVAYSKGY